MPTKTAKPAPTDESRFFVKELAGENPPLFATLKQLYAVSTQLYQLAPWNVWTEDKLVLIRDSRSGEMCYCSVMGTLGECLGMHAYIGDESYRTFLRLRNGEQVSPGEFLASQHTVYVDYGPMNELDKEDRKLLKALGHPRGAQVGPEFRVIRRGYHPWFVTEEEAQLLIQCVRTVSMIYMMSSKQPELKFWPGENFHPLVSEMEVVKAGEKITEQRCRIQPTEMPMPPEKPPAYFIPDEKELQNLTKGDHRIGGVLELDHFLTGMVVGKKNERKACICIAMAADAKTGFVFRPEIAPPGMTASEALIKALLNAIHDYRGIPQEVRVKSASFKESIEPIASACGFSVKVLTALPAVDRARTEMLRTMEGRGGLY